MSGGAKTTRARHNMRDEDRYQHQAAYCRQQAAMTTGTQAAQWLKLAGEYDKLLATSFAPRRATAPSVVHQQQQQQQQQPMPKAKPNDAE